MPAVFHRLIAAWSLLALMALVVTPRSVFHRCGHSEVSHHEAIGGTAIENDCPVCDNAVPAAVQERITRYRAFAEIVVLVQVRELYAPLFGHALRSSDRGPPALI